MAALLLYLTSIHCFRCASLPNACPPSPTVCARIPSLFGPWNFYLRAYVDPDLDNPSVAPLSTRASPSQPPKCLPQLFAERPPHLFAPPSLFRSPQPRPYNRDKRPLPDSQPPLPSPQHFKAPEICTQKSSVRFVLPSVHTRPLANPLSQLSGTHSSLLRAWRPFGPPKVLEGQVTDGSLCAVLAPLATRQPYTRRVPI